MTWKAPYRPSNEVTQGYNSGVVTVYAVTDSARPGYQPVEQLTEKIKLRYEEQRLGIQRYYNAMQNQIDIEKVIRTPRVPINNQNIAVTEDGRQYGIDMVQSVMDAFPPCIDITLTKIEQVAEL